jgi:hypothetical protein
MLFMHVFFNLRHRTIRKSRSRKTYGYYFFFEQCSKMLSELMQRNNVKSSVNACKIEYMQTKLSSSCSVSTHMKQWHPESYHTLVTSPFRKCHWFNCLKCNTSVYKNVLKVIPFKSFSTSHRTTYFDQYCHHQGLKSLFYCKLFCFRFRSSSLLVRCPIYTLMYL